MTTLADYRGRQLDVYAFRGPVREGHAALLEMELVGVGQGGQAIAGVLKLAQRFLLELLTDRGSIPFLPDRGTYFLTEARMGGWRTHLDVRAAFARAVSFIRRALRAEERDGALPDDERFGSAEVLNVQIGPGRVRLDIAIQSASGDGRQVLFPLSIAF